MKFIFKYFILCYSQGHSGKKCECDGENGQSNMYHFIREGDIVPAALFVKDLIDSFSAILNGLGSLGGKLIIEPIIKHFLP